MNTRKKAIAGLAAVAVGGILGIGGFAIAAFTQDTNTGAVAAGAETFQTLTITGSPVDEKLWPGQSTDVTLSVGNPNTTKIVVTDATHVALTLADVTTANPAHKGYCRSKLMLADYAVGTLSGPNAEIAAEATEPVLLANAITLDSTADSRCEGMTFDAKWTVHAETNFS